MTLTGAGEDFKGFILQARKYGHSTVLGNFRQVAAGVSVKTCTEQNDTVTGWLSAPRNKLTFTWVAPDKDVGTVQFV